MIYTAYQSSKELAAFACQCLHQMLPCSVVTADVAHVSKICGKNSSHIVTAMSTIERQGL